MSPRRQLDVERVICRLADIEDPGARGFAMGSGDWPLRGLVVRVRSEVRGYVNRCPHAGHPLNLRPHRFLSPDATLILCSSHGAVFERLTGYCVAGPCAGQMLQPVPLKVESGFVMLDDAVDPAAYADQGRC
jgi:nitrite reductase/ring-hydroxylating ferredoxin subunit